MECTSYKSKDHCSAITTITDDDGFILREIQKMQTNIIYLEAKTWLQRVAVGYDVESVRYGY